MKLTIALVGSLLLGSTAFAQAPTPAIGGTQYDLEGNIIGPHGSGILAPGDVWSSITSPFSNNKGLAPYMDGLLVSTGNLVIYHISATTGAQLAAFPVASNSDAWLGYDSSRDLILTVGTNGLMRGYTPGNATPVFEVVTATTRPVGVAWDPTRDEYAYCDWLSNDIVVYDATTLSVSRTFNMPGLTRMAGVAYDCTDDVYVVGDRDQAKHFGVHPLTGAIQYSYTTADPTGGNNPQGAALSGIGGVWTTVATSSTIYEQEAGHGPSAGCTGDPGSAYCFGDATGASCPCSAFGAPGQGCANTSGTGATLTGAGNAQASNDTFQLDVVGVPGNKPGLVLRGNNQVALPAGDGILCTVGGSQRSHVQTTSAGSTTFTNFSGANFGAVSNVGAVTNFQFWYRDPQNACTGTGFNFTNGWAVTYLP